MKISRVIISGGGTGGHIFPAVAIADEIKRRNPNADILFVGAKGKMEMEKVPAAGYRIEGLTIAGFQRKLTLSNFLLPFKIAGSMMAARKIVKDFKPSTKNQFQSFNIEFLQGIYKLFIKTHYKSDNPTRNARHLVGSSHNDPF